MPNPTIDARVRERASMDPEGIYGVEDEISGWSEKSG